MNIRLAALGALGYVGARSAGYEPLQIAIELIQNQILGSAIPF